MVPKNIIIYNKYVTHNGKDGVINIKVICIVIGVAIAS